MNGDIDIKTLIQLNIGKIKELEEERKKSDNRFWDIIDRQKESIAFAIEQEKIDNDWAENFLKGMEIK